MIDMKSPPSDDWRRQGQEKYLSGRKLLKREFAPYSAQWEHDHCEFCGRKFSVELGDDNLQRGFSTEDSYHWICDDCFADFKYEFGWIVDP